MKSDSARYFENPRDAMGGQVGYNGVERLEVAVMQVALLEITLRLDWVHSLKEKRGEVKSLLHRVQNRFHISAMESGAQDIHQRAELAFVMLAAHRAQGDAMMEAILTFIEENTRGEVTEVQHTYL